MAIAAVQRHAPIVIVVASFLSIIFCHIARAESPGTSPNPIIDTLMSGKVNVQLRYRYEYVDDDLVPANDAHASTLRAALGYETGQWRGLSAFAEMEHVAQLGPDDYREGPGTVDLPKAGRFPVVADPPGTELNRAFVKYVANSWLSLKIGRQYITYRKAPLHRHVGNVLWRQNWQTQDAFTVKLTPQKGLTVNYSYSAQVNRIFGEDAPSPFNRFDCDCHLVNASYTALPYAKFEVFGYLLDVDNAAANNHNTFGGRIYGAYPFAEKWKLLYAGEYATQDDTDGNPFSVDSDYYLAEGGLGVKLDNPWIKSVILKFDYEVLEGDGTPGSRAFNTPLATGHAFQGWADRFLTTPIDGIEDFYITLIAKAFGGKFLVSYHMLESDNLDYEYGDELNIQYTHKFAKYFTFGAKAAVYNADRNALSLARAGALPNNDVTRVWAWLQFDY